MEVKLSGSKMGLKKERNKVEQKSTKGTPAKKIHDGKHHEFSELIPQHP